MGASYILHLFFWLVFVPFFFVDAHFDSWCLFCLVCLSFLLLVNFHLISSNNHEQLFLCTFLLKASVHGLLQLFVVNEKRISHEFLFFSSCFFLCVVRLWFGHIFHRYHFPCAYIMCFCIVLRNDTRRLTNEIFHFGFAAQFSIVCFVVDLQ